MFVQLIVLVLAVWSRIGEATTASGDHPIVKRQIFNPCLFNNPCQNGATCIFALVNRVNYVTSCTCAAGFAGATCSVATSGTIGSTSVICAALGCLNGGTCIQLGSNAYCQCPSGFSGVRCQVQSGVSATCVGLQCYNGGACTTNGVVAYCICPTGTFGQYCQFGTPSSVVTVTAATGTTVSTSTLTTSSVAFNCLNNTICQNGGTCFFNPNPPYSISCRCPATFSGAFCQSRSTFCSTSPCLNGGTCVQNTFDLNGQCSCPTGFTGSYCEAFNCTSTNNPCRNNQQCLNVNGLPYCFCTSLYTGIYCETVVNLGKRR